MRDDAPPDPPPRLPGFNAYADDRPRGGQPLDTPADGDPDAAWGDADISVPHDVSALDNAPPNWRKPALFAAAGVAVIGMGAVLAAQSFGSRPASEAAADPSLRVELAQPAPPPTPQASPDRLEVLNAAPAPVLVPAPVPDPAAQALAEPRRAPGREALAPRRPLTPPEPTRRLAAGQASPADTFARDAAAAAGIPPRIRGACGDAASWAAALVCRDRELASLDQRMRRAYAAARDAGVPEGALREDQRDWLDIREEAARHSRNAVEDIYRQRIDELQEAVQAHF